MKFRALFLLMAMVIPFQQASADNYKVQPGDTLGTIASRYHVSIGALARANGIINVNLIRIGRVLVIPVPTRKFYYRVRWGDTLIGISSRYNVGITTIRSMNPSLGTYPLAGQFLRLCGPCSSTNVVVLSSSSNNANQTTAQSGVEYIVQPGDTLSGIASRYGVTSTSLRSSNNLSNPDLLVVGSRLVVPSTWGPTYAPWQARSLITAYARWYGVEAAFPLAVAWQESGFNQTLTSSTGAVGVMQVEPYTAQRIASLLGRQLDLTSIDDNVHAGVFWLAHLLAYYGGNERLAAAAYYQGTQALATHGFFQDTIQYVENVMALKSNFGG